MKNKARYREHSSTERALTALPRSHFTLATIAASTDLTLIDAQFDGDKQRPVKKQQQGDT